MMAAMPMKFAVRYWSSLLPDFRKPNGDPHWVDYSLHPASKLGLHNALLTLHDRLQILEQHGGLYECSVFVIDADKEEMLTQEAAEHLFFLLPHGEVKWLDIRNFLLLPLVDKMDEAASAATSKTTPTKPPAEQLSLFEHIHTLYDDVVEDAVPGIHEHEIETDA